MRKTIKNNRDIYEIMKKIYYDRKTKLYDYIKSKGVSIGNLTG